MSFAYLSWAGVLAGLAGLALLLYGLQHLTVRRREVQVVSTLLWRKALQEAPARSFWQRFRHLWAFFLLLLICGLLWVGFAEPKRETGGEEDFHFLVLDGSAGMAAGDRFAESVAALYEAVEVLPAARRQVIWSGAETLTLLDSGESAPLLQARLQELRPEATPARVERLLSELADIHRGNGNIEVTLFGDAPVSRAVLDSLPQRVSVRRALPVKALKRNSGITALGVADAASGAWNKVDVVIEVQGDDDAPAQPADLRIELNGKPMPQPVQWATKRESEAFLVKDVPAEGGLLSARLSAQHDALTLDDAASIRLPEKPLLRVQVSASIGASLRAALLADPAVQITESDPMLVVRRQGETVGGSLPSLELTDPTRQGQAFVLTCPADCEKQERLREAVRNLGLQQIDAMALAGAIRRPIEVSMHAGDRWQISLWGDLLSDEFDFTGSSAFPLFVANAVRWLADVPTAYSYAAAGRPLPEATGTRSTVIVDAEGKVIDSLGVSVVPERAGVLPLANARPLSVALLDPATTLGLDVTDALSVQAIVAPGKAGSGFDSRWLLILALILLGVEWRLNQQGRVP